MVQVNQRLDTLHRDLETMEREFRESRMELALYKERQLVMSGRIDKLEQRSLDDSGSFKRPTGRRPA
jgi:hypothetical protein